MFPPSFFYGVSHSSTFFQTIVNIDKIVNIANIANIANNANIAKIANNVNIINIANNVPNMDCVPNSLKPQIGPSVNPQTTYQTWVTYPSQQSSK